MDIKQKLKSIFDELSFVETDAYLQSRQSSLKEAAKGDGVLTGYGTIEGRLVYAAFQDSSFLGGALGEMHAKKIAKVVNIAVTVGAPVVIFFDSKGVRLKEGLHAIAGYGEILTSLSNASGMIPIISVILGSSFGLASYTASMADFVIMTNESQLSNNSPEVIKASDNLAGDDIGSAEFNASKSGVADLVCQEDELSTILHNILSYLPDNNLEGAPSTICDDDLNRSLKELTGITDSEYDICNVISSVADNNVSFEINSMYARNIITAFIRLNGRVTGVIANQGLLTGNSLSKAAKFIRMCDSFNIPLLTFTDAEGFEASYIEEASGISRNASKLVFALIEATVPKVNVILNKAYGGAYLVMNSKHIGADFIYAWDKACISPLSEQASAIILCQSDIASSDDPVSAREEKIKEYKEKFSNPYEAAKLGYVDDVIKPEETRVRVISAFEMLSSKRVNVPARKHGNIKL